MAMSSIHMGVGAIQAASGRSALGEMPAQQEPEMSCAMKRLDRIVEELESVVSGLVARLEPVLQPPMANPVSQSAPGVRAVHSPLGDMVQNESDRIAAIRDRIEEALSRLAV